MAEQTRKQPGTGIGVGGSSILAVFVVLCLTTFATLSLVSANADLRLSRKSAESVSAYYTADAGAQALLAQLDELARQTAGDPASFERQALELEGVSGCIRSDAALVVTLSVPVADSHTLEAEADFLPAVAQSAAPVILRYQEILPEEPAGQGPGLNVWDGTFPGPAQ